MGYLYALAHNLYDKSTAMRAVLLLAVLPFGCVTGALMTPDAPLMATWAATLYYMERALIADRRWAWLGMGIAFGLGILSKYTLGLLGMAALVFVVLDPESRRWLRRPHAYLAAALALLLFFPGHHLEYRKRLGIDFIPIRASYRDRESIFAAPACFSTCC